MKARSGTHPTRFVMTSESFITQPPRRERHNLADDPWMKPLKAKAKGLLQ